MSGAPEKPSWRWEDDTGLFDEPDNPESDARTLELAEAFMTLKESSGWRVFVGWLTERANRIAQEALEHATDPGHQPAAFQGRLVEARQLPKDMAEIVDRARHLVKTQEEHQRQVVTQRLTSDSTLAGEEPQSPLER